MTYNHTYTNSKTINNTYAYGFAKEYASFDQLFSNSFKFFQCGPGGPGLADTKCEINLSVGSGMQWTNFTSDNTTKDITVSRNYINYTPTVNFSYQFSARSISG